jgi:hypothetical protein
MMTHHSMHLKLPSTAPYDGPNDLASFVGNHVRPLANKLNLFWFSKYGAPGAREIKFRFSTDDYDAIRKDVEGVEAAFPHGSDGCGAYNYENDLGGDRFIAPGRATIGKASRALLVYQFLTAGARLFVDCLEPDGIGWKPEAETASNYNRETPLETFHHLFCNMTSVPTWAAVLQLPGRAPNELGPLMVVSDLQARTIVASDPKITLTSLPRIDH